MIGRERSRYGRILAGVVAALSLAACAPTDLGSPCHLLRADNTEASPRPGHDIVQSGSGECEQFTCASFAGAAPTCSRPCSQDDECSNGWSCRAVVLDPELLAAARARTEGKDANGNGLDDFDEFVGGVRDSLYCGPK